MMKRLLFFLLFLPIIASAKDFQVKMNMKNFPAENKPILLKVFNGNTFIVDSLPTLQNNSLTFKVPGNTAPGTFRAILGQSPYSKFMSGQPTYIDFVFNKENIEFSFDFLNPNQTIEVISSKENKVYFNFLKQEELYSTKLGLLVGLLAQYPTKDEFYNLAVKNFETFQHERNKFIKDTYTNNPGMLASKVINTLQMPFTPGVMSAEARDSVFKAQFLDNIDFSDTALLYTNIYTDKIYQYINFFMKRDLGQRENEEILINVMDEILPRISTNIQVRNTLLQFLINAFESMKMEEVLAHISNYLQQCESTGEIDKRRLESYKKLAIGQTVPDMVVMDIDNNPVSLYENVNPYTLIIFWRTDCGHCHTLTDELAKYVKTDDFKKHNVKIISVSVDETADVWKQYCKQNKFEWINAYAEGGLMGEVGVNYNIFGTPTLFLVDDTNKILAKPLTFPDLKKALERL